MADSPYYGIGKYYIVLRPVITVARTLVNYRTMSPKIQHEIQEVNLYDIGWSNYLTGNNFWNLNGIRPRKVFMNCPFDDYGGWPMKGVKGWHAQLEVLTLRIDVRPKDKAKLENELLLEKTIKKVGGGILELVDDESNVWGTWDGLDLRGSAVTWQSLTNVWRA